MSQATTRTDDVDRLDVARWMVEQIRARRRVDGSELADEAARTFGEQWVVRSGDNIRFAGPVLAAFRRLHRGSVRWQLHHWESVV